MIIYILTLGPKCVFTRLYKNIYLLKKNIYLLNNKCARSTSLYHWISIIN